MKIVRENIIPLNEELLGSYVYFSKKIEIYKNPPTAKRMGPWTRAITTLNGNFYVADNYATSHMKIIQFLYEKNELPNPAQYYNANWGYENLVAWQRWHNSNEYFLAESYSSEWIKENIEQLEEWAKNIFRKDIDFTFEQIPDNDFI